MTSAGNFAVQYELVTEWLSGIVGGYSDSDFSLSLAPGKNHALWILGHLVTSDDDLSLFLGKGELLFPEYTKVFSQGCKLIPPEECPQPAELKNALQNVIEKNRKIYSGLTEDELDTPHSMLKEGEDDYFKTKRRVLISWQLHTVYHTGQLGAIISAAGKRVYG